MSSGKGVQGHSDAKGVRLNQWNWAKIQQEGIGSSAGHSGVMGARSNVRGLDLGTNKWGLVQDPTCGDWIECVALRRDGRQV